MKRLLMVATAILAYPVAANSQADTDFVDVTAAKYQTGCPTPFDVTGNNNDLCQVRNALADTKATTGYRTLQFPPGIIKIETPTLSAALVLPGRVSLAGAGQHRTDIFLGNSKGAFLQSANNTGCNGELGDCVIELHDLSITGSGLSTTGDVMDIYNTPFLHFWNTNIRQVNGFGVNLVNDTERSYFEHMFIDTTLGVRSVGDGNETYFTGVDVEFSGILDGNACTDGPMCNANGSIRTSGQDLPNAHMAVDLDGVVNEWNESSIKSTALMGGLKMPPEGGSFRGGYIESAAPGAMNTAITIGDGKLELGHLTAAISATATVLPIDDARWQKPYVTDPALAKTIQVGAGRAAGCIYPADHTLETSPTDQTPSSAVPGVVRSYCELITVAASAGDGNMYLQGTRNGHAWPAGSVVEMNPHGTYGVALVQGVHINSVSPFAWNSQIQDGCDNSAQLTSWTSSPSRLCAEIIVGAVPDGYAVPFMHVHYSTWPAALHLLEDTFYTNNSATSEQDGQGWVKIPSNGAVVIDESDGVMSGTPSRLVYQNGGSQVEFLKDALGGTALGQINDPSARYLSDTSNSVFDAYQITGYNQPMLHYTLNAPAATPALVTH